MNYTLKLVTVLCFLFSNSFGQEMIREVRYITAPAPNYRVKKNIANPLTDGKNAVHDIFWLDPQTAGWEKRSKITLDFVFDREYFLSEIALTTAMRESADVFLPLNIHVFLSTDNKAFSYLGDMMKSSRVPRDNVYRITELKLAAAQTKAKYVKFVIIPGGTFFFTDEIRFYATESGHRTKKTAERLNSAQMDSIVKREKYTQINRSFLFKQIDEEFNGASAEQKNELKKLRAQISAENALADSSQYQTYETKIWKTRVRPGLKRGLIVTKYDSPWITDLSRKATGRPAKERAAVPVLKEFVTSGVHVTTYFAYSLFNNTGGDLFVTPELRRLEPEEELSLHLAKVVRSNDFKLIPDALIPLRKHEQFRLRPGESRVLLISYKSDQAGDNQLKINLQTSREAHVIIDLRMNVLSVSPGFGEGRPPISINTWAYLNFPTLKGREKSAREDLLSHYVNSYVIHTSVLQPNVVQSRFPALEENLKYIKGADQVMLFLNHRQLLENPGSNYMSEAWKQQFLVWYDRVISLITESGIDKDNVYLYPYDEVRPGEVLSFQTFVNWIRSARENVKIFVTVVSKGVLPRLTGYADIYQLYDNPEVLKEGSAINGQAVWYYDIIESSKSASPYKDYRLMGWKAFKRGLEGIGFWNYADVGNNRKEVSVWDDFDGHRPDYAVVYDRGGQIIPSRRWEAFKAGIEDYMFLEAYSRKFGRKAALALCESVLAASDNYLVADTMREKMLVQLSMKNEQR